MFEKTKKEPELGFTNKKEIFEFDKEYSYINQIYFENHEITENDVCKVQTITNLKQVNHLFENLEKNEMTKSEDGTYFYSNTRGLGDRCFICKENDEIKMENHSCIFAIKKTHSWLNFNKESLVCLSSSTLPGSTPDPRPGSYDSGPHWSNSLMEHYFFVGDLP